MSVRRFLSVRDRDRSKERKHHVLGRHHDHDLNKSHNVSSPDLSTKQARPDPNSAADFWGLFYSGTKPAGHSEEFKIKAIRQRLIDSKGVAIREGTILWSLRSPLTDGDDDRAYRFLLSLSDALEGLITSYDANVKMRGSVNRQGVTCYLDSTLFSMFSRLDSFEAMLYNTFPDRPRQKLSFLLRLWVNMLRTGQLVTTDITEMIQQAIRECGWEAAAELEQHDASEAFTFITGKLELPLLTLKMDIYHTGKEDASDDHKFVNERLLDVAIPEDPTGQRKVITLEDCLEDYFNNRVEVKRYLERRSTLTTIKAGADNKTKSSAVHVEVSEVDPESSPATPVASFPDTRPPNKHRSQSIIQERFIPARGDSDYSALANIESHNSSRSRAGSVRKEVLMPAWQFFSLIPWYTDNTPSSDAQVAAHFSSKRPVLGLCLKRYAYRNGRSVRLNTYVDIPVEIGLPHFIQDDHMTDEGALHGNFKLSLQAVVCHRGSSVESGHYIALVREGNAVVEWQHSDSAVPSGWVRFDDLASERVMRIDINKGLREETPYLLFYQILPVEGDPGDITAGEEGTRSQLSLPLSRTSTAPSPAMQPGVEVTTVTPVESPQNHDAFDGRRASVVSFSDGVKSLSGTSSPNLDQSRRGSADLGRVISKNSESGGGIRRSLSKLRRRSRDPEPQQQAPSDPAQVQAVHEPKPDVQDKKMSHAESFAPTHQVPQQSLQPPARVEARSAYHESQALPSGPTRPSRPVQQPDRLEARSAYQESQAHNNSHGSGQDHRRSRSKTRLTKVQKGKDKHPDRECIVM